MPLTAGKVHAAQIAWLQPRSMCLGGMGLQPGDLRSEEHTSELQSQSNLVCRLLLEKKSLYSVTSGFRTSPATISSCREAFPSVALSHRGSTEALAATRSMVRRGTTRLQLPTTMLPC